MASSIFIQGWRDASSGGRGWTRLNFEIPGTTANPDSEAARRARENAQKQVRVKGHLDTH